MFDALLMLVLLYAVYARTPLGAIAETGVRMVMGQTSHPSWFATFKGRETVVSVSAPQLQQAASKQLMAPAIKAAAQKAHVDEEILAALIAAHGSCDATTCTMPAPPNLFEALGELGLKDRVPIDDVAQALAILAPQFNHDPQLAVEALYLGRAPLTRALDRARDSGLENAADVEAHAEFLTPAARRGRLQSALPVLALYRLRSLAWPADGAFRITSPFGERIHPVTGEKRFHNGTDIGMPTGETLHSAHNGVIKRASRDSTSGNYVIVDHGLGIETTYCHMSRTDVTEKRVVTRREVLGASGATGRVTGPHLHYILRINTNPVDAEQYGESPTRTADITRLPTVELHTAKEGKPKGRSTKELNDIVKRVLEENARKQQEAPTTLSGE